MKTVLFVCVENSNRSQMAEAFARLHGGDRVRDLIESRVLELLACLDDRAQGVEVTPCHGREFPNAGHADGLVLETCGVGAAGCDPIRTRLSRSSDAGGDAGAAVPPVCPDATSP